MNALTRSRSCSSSHGFGNEGGGGGKGEKRQRRAEANRKYQEAYRIKGVEARQKLPELYARIAELERENSRLKDMLWKQRDPEGWEMAQKQQNAVARSPRDSLTPNNQISFLAESHQASPFHSQQPLYYEPSNSCLSRPAPIEMPAFNGHLHHSVSCQNLGGFSGATADHHFADHFGQSQGGNEELWNQSWTINEPYRCRSASVQSQESVQSCYSTTADDRQWLPLPAEASGGEGPPLGGRAPSFNDVCINFPAMSIDESTGGIQNFERPISAHHPPVDGFFAPPFAMDIMADPNAPNCSNFARTNNVNIAPLTTINEDTPRLYSDLASAMNTPMFQ